MKPILFKETQKNTSPLLIVPGLIAVAVFGCLSFAQIVSKKPIGNHPAPTWLLLLFFAGCSAGILILSLQRLLLVITEDEIEISFGIFAHRQIIKINEIKNISVRKYDALKEFWGWGVRFNSKGRCYTVSGNAGVDIELKSGQHILIGIRELSEADAVISAYFNHLK